MWDILKGHSWTTRDLAVLREHAALGAEECAAIMGLSVPAVKKAAARYRISLRRPGSRRGLIMGQPRGISLRQDVRASLVADRRDELVAERMRIDGEAALCPCCGVRPVRVRSTGFCTACHMHRLADHHDEAAADAEAIRRLAAARQRKKAVLDAAVTA